ncbi:MAG: division/cell wall cluster transcriptional repressor MraZ, partial [Planctomycetota bacterium]
MLLLTGEYQHVVDSKSRVLISTKLRSQIDVDEHGSNFYLVLGANGILCLYPEKYFELIALAVGPGATAPDEAVAFERISFALASKVELDGQGRLLLNERLRKRAGLKDQITLVGVTSSCGTTKAGSSTLRTTWPSTRNKCRRHGRLSCRSTTKNFEIWRQDEMIGTDSNHCRIVAESLAGDRGVDEKT